MADEQKPGEAPLSQPGGSETPPSSASEKPAPPAKPAVDAAKPAPKPAAPAAHAPPKPPPVMAATPWEGDLPREVKERFGDAVSEASTYLGQNFLVVKPDSAISILEYLKLEADFDYLVDVTAVDWPKRAERFDLVHILYSFSRNERIRVKAYIKDGYKPETATGVHLTANWLE